jgi:hypothetical protein
MGVSWESFLHGGAAKASARLRQNFSRENISPHCHVTPCTNDPMTPQFVASQLQRSGSREVRSKVARQAGCPENHDE